MRRFLFYLSFTSKRLSQSSQSVTFAGRNPLQMLQIETKIQGQPQRQRGQPILY